MKFARRFVVLSLMSLVAAAAPLGGCEKKSEPAKPATEAPVASKPVEAAAPQGDGHSHGATTELGEQPAGGYTVKASRDGEVTPGKDAPIDAWVSGGTAKVSAVRFWIGTEDAKGSVKAKAELERDNWHTHAEIPNPLPEGSRLWVEIESEGGEKSVVGFDLKM